MGAEVSNNIHLALVFVLVTTIIIAIFFVIAILNQIILIKRFVGGGHGGFAAFFNAGVHTVRMTMNNEYQSIERQYEDDYDNNN